jgi:MYXO-CTERM domain-containing protein
LPPMSDGGSKGMGHPMEGPGLAPPDSSGSGCSVVEARPAGPEWSGIAAAGMALAAITRRRRGVVASARRRGKQGRRGSCHDVTSHQAYEE